MKTFRKGGTTNETVQSIAKQKTNHGTIQLPNASLNKYIGKKEGGLMKKDMMKDDVEQDKKVVKKAIGMHDTQLHGGKKTNLTKLAKGGSVKASSASKRADGCAIRGKTKA
jgi:hypothetical protein